ncbi:MAG: NUDIX domain-containing protein [Eikenella sp.]|nr:NUDIX domain-containing protein [Eikenella sp.]
MPHFPIPFSARDCAALLDLLQQRFAVDEAAWVPLYLNRRHLGYLKQPWLSYVLADWPHCLAHNKDGVWLAADDWLMLADALQNMAHGWHRLGYLNGWRNERFAAEDEAGNALFALERAAFRPLGLCSRAVHINGLAETGQGRCFWMARRSPFKAVDPDKLDNLVGGGLAAGESIAAALLREGFEEAGLPAALLAGAAEQSRLLSLREVPRGLHREWLHVFDVLLPAGWTPENQDGEVAEFMLLAPQALLEAMLAGRLMNDALLATLDACLRHGLVPADTPLADWLRRRSVPAA